MNKFIRGLAVAAALVAGTALLGAPSANAANHDNVCDVGESCVFYAFNYGGGMDDMATTDSDWRGNYFSSGYAVNDAASSGFGNERAERYYAGISFTSYNFTLGVDQYDPVWTDYQPNSTWKAYNFNDQVSSNAVYVP